MADITAQKSLNLKTLHQEVDDVLQYNNIPEANKLSSAIKKALKDPKLDQAIAGDLNKYLGLLNWVCILSVSDETLFAQLKNHIQECYSIPDYELSDRITDRFSLLDFPEDGAEFLTGVTTSLEANTEKLGSQTIGQWIKLYAQSAVGNSQKSGFDMVQFMQKNGTGLTEDQKAILFEVFKIYDSGKSWLAKYNALPVAQTDDDISESVVMDMLYGKEDESDKPSAVAQRPVSVDGLKLQQTRVPQPASAVRAQAPQPISPAPTKPPVPISDQSTNSIPDKTLSPSTASQPETPPTTDEIVEKIKRDEAKPETVSRLQELLHKNITPVSSPVTQPEKVPDPQTLIDDKISELKKRINSNE